MEEDRVISYDRGKQLADQLGIEFFETSAKDNINVKVTYIVNKARIRHNIWFVLRHSCANNHIAKI